MTFSSSPAAWPGTTNCLGGPPRSRHRLHISHDTALLSCCRTTPQDFLRVSLGLLEEFPLDVVRVAEADDGRPERIMVQIGRYAMSVQGFGQLLQLFPARYANRKMVQADTPLTEVIVSRGSGQRRAEHQAVIAADPQPKLLAGKVLVDPKAEDSLVERAGSGEISDVEGDVVESGRHENHATGEPEHEAGSNDSAPARPAAAARPL